MPRSTSTDPSDPGGPPDLSVIVVAYRSREHVPACLAALPAAVEGLGFETLVVDNASADGTVEWLRAHHPDVRVVQNAENRGFAAAVNQGAGEARGQALLLLNPDAVPQPGSVARLWEAFRAGAAVAGPQLLDPDGSPQPSAWDAPGLAAVLFDVLMLRVVWPRGGHRPLPASSGPVAVGCLSGACLLVGRSVFAGLGGLDEGFFLYHEDFDFCLRARAAGHHVWAVPAARVIHHVGGSAFQDRAAFLYRYHESRMRLLRKHHPGRRGGLLAALHAGGLEVRRLVYALAGRGAEAAHLRAALRRLGGSR
jgi:N-acetylglucosaminyl-diphospho-decaprenol L-rhamnosyltransferase